MASSIMKETGLRHVTGIQYIDECAKMHFCIMDVDVIISQPNSFAYNCICSKAHYLSRNILQCSEALYSRCKFQILTMDLNSIHMRLILIYLWSPTVVGFLDWITSR